MSIAAAVLTVALRNPVHCGLALLALLLHVSGLFVLLNAEFLWAVQVMVYAGAILVLYLFVLMLLNLKTEERYFHSTYLYFRGSRPCWVRSTSWRLLVHISVGGTKGNAPTSADAARRRYLRGRDENVQRISVAVRNRRGFPAWAPSSGQSCWQKHRNRSADERMVTCDK